MSFKNDIDWAEMQTMQRFAVNFFLKIISEYYVTKNIQ